MKEKHSALTLVELLIVATIIAALTVFSVAMFNQSRGEKRQPAHYLPPGITDTNKMPELVSVEYHLGEQWVLARGKTNWSGVVYYPRYLSILSMRRLKYEMPGVIMPDADMVSYEIVASKREGTDRFDTECFRVEPLVPGTTLILIGVDEYSIGWLAEQVRLKKSGLEATPVRK